MPPIIPRVGTRSDYRRIYRQEHTWLPAMHAICDLHGLDPTQLAFGPPGTHVVFRLGSELYVKLFCPLWGSDYVSERLVLRALAGACRPTTLAIPELVAEGQVEGWPYIAMTALPGVPLCDVWHQMDVSDRAHIARRCGAFMASLHHVPVDGLRTLAVDWPAFVQRQGEVCLERIREDELGTHWERSVAAFLADPPPLYEPGFQPVLLSADVTDEHVLVSDQGGRWEATGYIDFGDAMLGHPLYEFAAPALSIARGDPVLLRAMLVAYGFEEGQLDGVLSDQLMAYTLLHRFIRIRDLLEMTGAEPSAGLGELQQVLWPFA